MKVFIDTNIFLRYYLGFTTEIYPLERLLQLIKNGDIELILTQQSIDEFYRNKDVFSIKTITALQEFQKNFKISVPNKERNQIKTIWSELKEIETKSNKELSLKINDLYTQVEENIRPNGKIEKLMKEIFKESKIIPVTKEILEKAQFRHALGNPPRKKNDNSLGDAINWEILLENFHNTDDLILLTGDSDFKVKSWKKGYEIKEFLKREWKEIVGSRITVYTKLTDLLEDYQEKKGISEKKLAKAKKEESLISQYYPLDLNEALTESIRSSMTALRESLDTTNLLKEMMADITILPTEIMAKSIKDLTKTIYVYEPPKVSTLDDQRTQKEKTKKS